MMPAEIMRAWKERGREGGVGDVEREEGGAEGKSGVGGERHQDRDRYTDRQTETCQDDGLTCIELRRGKSLTRGGPERQRGPA